MRKSIFPRLAADGLKKNRRVYLPYLFACTFTVMMFFIMLTLFFDGAFANLPGGTDVKSTMGFGCVIVAIFSAVLLFYTNGVLTKQRKREFGLYNVLGMEKRHIGRVIFWETVYTAAIAVTFGIISGVVFSKLMQLILMRIINADVQFALNVNPSAVAITGALFLGIFFVVYANTLRVVRFSDPVALLRGTSEGEKEPKSNWVLAILGVTALGAGYAISIMTESMYSALLLFFVAVILVIVGTYLCFTAFSIVFLKILRKNKGYYYQIRHFATVSGMLYRMKRNAAGLASICILSTMALVTISTTVCLYLGVDDIMQTRYSYDVKISYAQKVDKSTFDAVGRTIEKTVEEHALEITDYASYDSLQFVGVKNGSSITVDSALMQAQSGVEFYAMWITTQEGYENLTGKSVHLAGGEALYFTEDDLGNSMEILGNLFSISRMEPFETEYKNYITGESTQECILVVDSDETLRRLESLQMDEYGDAASTVKHIIRFNLTGSDAEKMACVKALASLITLPADEGHTGLLVSKQEKTSEDGKSFYGAFFFLGMFLGALFIMATVLIIYYKQVSEGFDDRARFSIMQKVGMTKKEVRGTIRTQVLIVFFLPLVTAGMHIAFAFPMIRKILLAFSMTNTRLFVLCILCTYAVFALMYTAVYGMTAHTYYSIVSDGEQA